MKERPVVFGGPVSLVGIVGEPAADLRAVNRPSCILVNAGLVHRVGPNRLYVRIARRLLAAGYPTFRFDLSGRGDSDVRRDSMSFLESSLTETRAAMDFLQGSTGQDRFVVMGICSGAANALQAAVSDPRVVGAVMIDGPAYPTLGYYLRYYSRRFLNAESWANTLSGRNELGRRLFGKFAPTPAEEEGNAVFGNPYGDIPMAPKSVAGAALAGVIDRGHRLLFIFSGSWGMYNYRNQFRDAFPALFKQGRLRVEYFPDADHTFTRLYNQERLVHTIQGWVSATWPAAADASTAEAAPPAVQTARRPAAPAGTYAVVQPDLSEAEASVIRLSDENLPPGTDRFQRYRWYYTSNPLGHGEVFLLTHANGNGNASAEVVGCTGISPRLFHSGSQTYRAALSADFAVDHSHRTVLPALRLQRAAHEYGVANYDLSYGFPNASAVGVFLRLGYKQLGKMGRYVKVLRHEPYIRRIGPLGRLAPAAARVVDAAQSLREHGRATLHASHLRFEWAADFDPEFDAVGAALVQQVPIAGQRTAEWLRWRFSVMSGSLCSIARLVDSRTMQLRAYAVLAQKEEGVARIGDFAALTPDDLSALFARLIPELRLKGFTTSVVQFLGPDWVRRVLHRHGFHLRHADRSVIIDPGGNATLTPLLTPDNWYLTAADTDT